MNTFRQQGSLKEMSKMDAEYYYCGTCKHGILYAKGCPKCEQEYEKMNTIEETMVEIIEREKAMSHADKGE